MKTKLYVCSLIVLVLSACGENLSPVQETTFLPESAIVGGKEAATDGLTSKYVVLIYDNLTETYCTGALIKNNVVLTAAHCIKSRAENLTLAFGTRPLAGQYVKRSVLKTLVHPQYNKTNKLNRNDLALILVKEGAPEGYKFLRIPDDSFPFKKDLMFTSVGYGRTTGINDPRMNDNQGSGFLRTVDLQVDSLSDDGSQFYVDQKDGKGICNGDSGGPAMMRLNGVDYAVGVASAISWTVPGELSDEAKQNYTQNNDVCKDKSIYINVKKFNNWILENSKKLLN